jgi:outer membrane receptor protein involved in Fe transport
VENFFSLQNSKDRPSITDFLSKKEVNSVFANASLGFKDIVFLDLIGRNDWSSTLPSNELSFSYGSATTSFIFSELIQSDILSFGKLRGGYALAGSDTDPYRLYSVYAPSGNFGSNPEFTVPGSKNNSELKPERTSSIEAGLDLNFLSSRIGLGFTYYSKTTEDLIYPVAVSGSTGYTSVIVNAGKMANKGVELSLNGQAVKLPNGFTWDLTINWAKNKNEIVELAEGLTSIRLATLFGGSLEAQKGVPYGAIVGADFVYDNGNKVVLADGNYDRTSPNQYLGSVLADWTGGIRNSFSYKGINLSFLVDGQFGGSVYSVSNMFGKYTGIFAETTEGGIRETGVILEGVQSDGSPNSVVISAQQAFYNSYRLHGAYVYDATYFKLRESSLSYSLPKSLIDKLPFKNISVSVIGRNLAFLYKKIPHVDPETTTNSGNIQGIEGAAVPPVRSWGFNLKFDL